ncbi:MAG: GNAT family N-acetyltransferase [Methylomicrobium sp.]
MNISDYRIEPADYRVDFNDLRFIRESVFVIDQPNPDDHDKQALHVIARDNRHAPIGAGRLTKQGRIDHFGVLEAWRNQGVGTSLLRTLIATAQKLGLEQVVIDAPEKATGFFTRLGFEKDGDVSIDHGIATQRLLFRPQAPNISARPTAKPRPPSVDIEKVISLETHRQATIRLIGDARRQLCIYTQDLEHSLYGHKDVVEAFKQFALNSRDGGALIIVQDTIAARSKPHPLLDLAQRLPSSFQFRAPVETEDQQYGSAFLLNDRDGFSFRLLADRYEGEWSPNHPARRQQLFEEFDRIWQRCRPCTEFRALGI